MGVFEQYFLHIRAFHSYDKMETQTQIGQFMTGDLEIN